MAFPFWRQVTGLFHNPSIGNAVHIVVVRLILLEEEEVRNGFPPLSFSVPSHFHSLF